VVPWLRRWSSHSCIFRPLSSSIDSRPPFPRTLARHAPHPEPFTPRTSAASSGAERARLTRILSRHTTAVNRRPSGALARSPDTPSPRLRLIELSVDSRSLTDAHYVRARQAGPNVRQTSRRAYGEGQVFYACATRWNRGPSLCSKTSSCRHRSRRTACSPPLHLGDRLAMSTPRDSNTQATLRHSGTHLDSGIEQRFESRSPRGPIPDRTHTSPSSTISLS
jgi:hypothetical protein